MKKICEAKTLTGERALFKSENLTVCDCIFADGESPLKESHSIDVIGCLFKWKYPLWYCHDINVRNSTWFEMARAGVWYTNNITISDSAIEAPKNFRRCKGLRITNTSIPNAEETLWSCSDVQLERVIAKGDYLGMNCDNMTIDGLTLYGNYCFDGAKNVVIKNSKLISKDAFWNSEGITVYDSYISGEYLGWNAKKLTLINCTVESLQGMCYIEDLVMKDCKLINTTLAFEYSSVDADILGSIDSVINPKSGRICADSIDKLIMDSSKIDPKLTTIICRNNNNKPKIGMTG